MIEPRLAGDRLLDDMRTATQADLNLWWLGQSGFLVKYDGAYLLLDPYLSDSLTVKYANTDKPHVRMTRRCVAPQRLDFVDLVTSSHNHTDHLDADTLLPLWRAAPGLVVVVPAANRQFAAERLQCDPERLSVIDDGQSFRLDPFRLHAVPAAHETVERDESGRCRFLGYVVQCGPYTIYHSGDTVPYEDQVRRLSPWAIDIALLPINGRSAERRVAGNLWGDEAAGLARQMGARVAIPCHYDMFTFNTDTPDRFLAACQRLGQACRVLECGQRFGYPEDV